MASTSSASAKRSAKFAEAEVANVTMAVADFFADAKLPRTPFLDGYLEVKESIYESGAPLSIMPRIFHLLAHIGVDVAFFFIFDGDQA